MKATKYTTGNNESDIWIEGDDGINYLFENAMFLWRGSYDHMEKHDFVNEELLPCVMGWCEEVNGNKIAILASVKVSD